MLVYFFLLGFLFFSALLFLGYKKNRKWFLIVSFAGMGIILGLRGNTVGEDTKHYLDVFESISNISWPTIFTSGMSVTWEFLWGQKVETGYAILNKLVSCITSNGQLLLFIVALLTCALFAKFSYDNIRDHVFFAAMFFLCDSLYTGAFNVLRQMLAVSIVINSYQSVLQKNYKKALLIIAAAFFIHNSSIVIVPFLFLLSIANMKKSVLYTLFGSGAALVLFPVAERVVSIALPRYTVYFNVNYWNASSLKGTLILWTIEIIMAVMICSKGIKTRKEYTGVIALVLYITVELIGQRIVAIGRLTYYFRAFTVFLFIEFSRMITPISRWIFYGIVLLLFTLEFFSYASTPSRQYVFFWQI